MTADEPASIRSRRLLFVTLGRRGDDIGAGAGGVPTIAAIAAGGARSGRVLARAAVRAHGVVTGSVGPVPSVAGSGAVAVGDAVRTRLSGCTGAPGGAAALTRGEKSVERRRCRRR